MLGPGVRQRSVSISVPSTLTCSCGGVLRCCVQVMGAGRDGGRDLCHDDPLVWNATDDGIGGARQGYMVFQVKHKARLSARPEENASWLCGQIRDELDQWVDPTSGRNPVPDFLVVVTNVPLTPVPGSGGHDRLNKAQLSPSSRCHLAVRGRGSAVVVTRCQLYLSRSADVSVVVTRSGGIQPGPARGARWCGAGDQVVVARPRRPSSVTTLFAQSIDLR